MPEQTPSSGSTPPLRLLPTQEDLAEAGTSFIESLRLAWSGLQQAAARAAAAVEEGFAWIDGHRDEIREFWNAARARIDSDWRYLLDLVDPATAIMVVLALEARDRYDERFETSVEDLLERGLLDAELIQRSAAVLAPASCQRHRRSSSTARSMTWSLRTTKLQCCS